ncbi:MAG: alpha/beta hydrolase [Vicinamibacterales bacterium]
MRPFKSDAAAARFAEIYEARLAAWPVPFEEIDVPTRVGTTHVVASGPPGSPPLVLLPALMASATVWRANIASLSRHFRTYAVDVIGEPNKSRPTRRIFRRRGYAEWLTDLFDQLEIERASLAGNSYGGFLAINQASLTPDRVERIILINPAATFAPIWAFYRHLFRPSFFRWIENGVAIDPIDANWGSLINLARREGRPVNFVPPRVLSRRELRAIRAPTLLLIGEKEVIYEPEATLARALAAMPGLQAEIVPGANHMAALTRPDEVSARIVAFLQAPDPAARRPRGANP